MEDSLTDYMRAAGYDATYTDEGFWSWDRQTPDTGGYIRVHWVPEPKVFQPGESEFIELGGWHLRDERNWCAVRVVGKSAVYADPQLDLAGAIEWANKLPPPPPPPDREPDEADDWVEAMDHARGWSHRVRRVRLRVLN